MKNNAARSPIPVLSFFTGAGFLDIGFKEAGFDLVWHNEIDPEFARGFYYGMSKLYGKPPVEPKVASIEDLQGRDILSQAFGVGTPPDEFGVIGGPPCPDFSVGGKNRGFEGDNGKLSKVFVDRIEELKPTFFVFENVPGLFRTKKHRAHFEGLVRQLAPYYMVDVRVLNALEFGVPQDRERVFFIGILRDWLRARGKGDLLRQVLIFGVDHWFPYPEPPGKYKNAKTRYAWPQTSPFGGNPDPPDNEVPRELMVGTYILQEEELNRLENSKDYFEPKSRRFWTVDEGDDSRKSFKRLHRYRYSPTAAYGNNEVHLHPTLPRRISVREAMRIQSVPDGFALPADMSLSDKFKTVGNGVPVRLASAIARSIMSFLQS